MSSSRNWLYIGLPCAAILLAVSTPGCRDSDAQRGTVEGTVTFNGTAVERGTISFIPTAGTRGPATYAAIENGKYSVTARNRGPVVGKHKVQIEAFRDMGKKHPTGAPLLEQVIPKKYNSQTTLVVAVAEGQNRHDFDLKSK